MSLCLKGSCTLIQLQINSFPGHRYLGQLKLLILTVWEMNKILKYLHCSTGFLYTSVSLFRLEILSIFDILRFWGFFSEDWHHYSLYLSQALIKEKEVVYYFSHLSLKKNKWCIISLFSRMSLKVSNIFISDIFKRECSLNSLHNMLRVICGVFWMRSSLVCL